MKKRKLKKEWKRIFILTPVCLFILILLSKSNYVKEITYQNGQTIINLNKNNISCIISDTPPTLESKWIQSKDKKCVLESNNIKENIYIKKKNKIMEVTNEELYYFEAIKKDKIYLPVNSQYQYLTKIIGNEQKIEFITDKYNVITISKEGKINTLNEGTVLLTTLYKKTKYEAEIVVTNLITTKPSNGYDFKKEKLSCNKYTKEENDMLDEILKDRINDAGYKTRAGVLEAARFLTLEFPYRINYFYENGRLTGNKVDGEGRYYHEGLYLNESRYNNISKSQKGPAIWGCELYSNPIKKIDINGLDCSGFVTWALLNGGFDVGDIGAGITDVKDLTEDIGTKKSNKKSLITDGTIKSGDLVHNTEAGGHIGMIVGIDDKYVYVAQALWYDEVGVIITKDTYNDFVKRFPDVVLMDKYYKEDGNYTKMW